MDIKCVDIFGKEIEMGDLILLPPYRTCNRVSLAYVTKFSNHKIFFEHKTLRYAALSTDAKFVSPTDLGPYQGKHSMLIKEARFTIQKVTHAQAQVIIDQINKPHPNGPI